MHEGVTRMQSGNIRINGARILIGLVTMINLQCAVEFLIHPDHYVSAFALDGSAGSAMVASMGLLFVMWNVPYVFAVIQPRKNRVSLYEAFIMQFIGLVGEITLLFVFCSGNPIVSATVKRFIIFDCAGWFALAFSIYLAY